MHVRTARVEDEKKGKRCTENEKLGIGYLQLWAVGYEEKALLVPCELTFIITALIRRQTADGRSMIINLFIKQLTMSHNHGDLPMKPHEL